MFRQIMRFALLAPRMWMHFADTGDAGGGPSDKKDDTGAKDGDKKGADDKGAKKDELKDRTFTLKGGQGSPRQVTLDEMQELAEKSYGADEKLRAGGEQLKKGEKGIRIGELVEKIGGAEDDKVDPNDVKDLATLLGIEAGELTDLLKPDGDDASKKGKDTKKVAPVGVKDLDTDSQEKLQWVKDKQLDEALTKVKEICKTGVDKDSECGKIVGRYEDKDQEVVKGEIAEYVFKEVQRRILLGEAFGASLVGEVVQNARNHFQRYGISAQTTKQPPPILGLGPSDTLTVDVQANEPIKRVESTDPDYLENLVKRTFQKAIQGFRGRK